MVSCLKLPIELAFNIESLNLKHSCPMLSSGTTKERDRQKPSRKQARDLLRTMCSFMLPLLPRANENKTLKEKKIHFGIEADEFIIELEKFISGMISHSQRRSQDIVMETNGTLGKDPADYLEGTSWLWDILVVEDEATIVRGANDNRNLEHYPVDQETTVRYTSPAHVLRCSNDREFALRFLRSFTQGMPIRLLYFQYHNSNMKISLLERADIFNYLAPKFLESDMPIFECVQRHARYAILSHTWTQNPEELTYRDWLSGSVLNDKRPKCRKLVNFCKAALENHGVTFGWIDTVCINKESSAELDESIRSMFKWYQSASVCITYLAGTDKLSDMRYDRWFTRGWTLQELVAPQFITFYNKDWTQLSKRYMDWHIKQEYQPNDKTNDLILEEIRHATSISRYELNHFRNVSLSRKMQLAAKREVTREEDIAYCLMGVFNVSISTAYGEGEGRAFFRLVEEIFRSTKDVSDIFNWAGYNSFSSITSLFPSSPSNYLHCLTNQLGPCLWRSWQPIEPLTLTHLGLRTPLLLMPAILNRKSVSDYPPLGDYRATVSVHYASMDSPENYHVLDKGISDPDRSYDLRGQKIALTFGTLNVEEQGSSMHIPKTCLAVLLKRPWGEDMETSVGYTKVPTEKPIVFDLKKTAINSCDDEDKHYYQIERNELAKHGMKLVTLYL